MFSLSVSEIIVFLTVLNKFKTNILAKSGQSIFTNESSLLPSQVSVLSLFAELFPTTSTLDLV